MEWWEPGACIDTPLSSSGLHTQACILLQKLVLYSRNKASRRQMSSTLPSLPPGQMAKLDNMLSKITLKSHGRVCVCSPVCRSILPPVRPGWHPGHLLLGCGAWAGGEAALFGTVRKLEPASLLLIDIGALQWDVGPAGASADEIGGWRRGGLHGQGDC